MDLSYKLKPPEERIGLWRDRYAKPRTCGYCKTRFTPLIAYWKGHTLVRITSAHQRLYCSEECKTQALYRRRRERYANRDKNTPWSVKPGGYNQWYYEIHKEEIKLKRKIKYNQDRIMLLQNQIDECERLLREKNK